MNDKYLWDRTGEVDPEIQQLEATLGELRYRPRPFHIPDQLQIRRRRRFYPSFAIAAGIALLAIALGAWFMVKVRRVEPTLATRHSESPKQIQNQPPQKKDQPPQLVKKNDSSSPVPKKHNRESNRNLVAVNARKPRVMIRQPRLTPEELAQKEQVLVALRLVSAKLNIAQRRTQGLPATNSIRNQHKMG